MPAQVYAERLARLLHNRVVRRVRHDLPTAECLLLVGDLAAAPAGPRAQLHPVAVWDARGEVLADFAEPDRRRLVDDLRPEFALLGRVAPVALFEPYLLGLRQLPVLLDG
jgi:hypothetical protein